ncbi:MAG: RNA polymerase sigma factor [Idiomarina sp.]
MQPELIEALVLATQEGDKRAHAALYAEFHRPMARFALLRVKNAMVAEDLVQNVWLKISHRLDSLRDVSLFRSWLYRALRWEITDWARSQQRLEFRDINEAELNKTYPVENYDIYKLLKQLTTDERDVVELFYLNELSLTETALALSIPEGTVKSRLARARTKLKHLFEKSE